MLIVVPSGFGIAYFEGLPDKRAPPYSLAMLIVTLSTPTVVEPSELEKLKFAPVASVLKSQMVVDEKLAVDDWLAASSTVTVNGWAET